MAGMKKRQDPSLAQPFGMHGSKSQQIVTGGLRRRRKSDEDQFAEG
jgi:hypothetical protein